MEYATLPDFIVIGAMKSATTTLHEQLRRQRGLIMSQTKEPNFFSDDENYAKGLEWYASCFPQTSVHGLRGESSTHYTKLPTYPQTVNRMQNALARVKLIYVMRHPIDRLISHFLHEITVGQISCGLEEAVAHHPELVDYGRYSFQLEPYFKAYGRQSVLPVFFDRLVAEPDEELERIGRFLGTPQPLCWDHSLGPQNVGRERLRSSHLRNVLVQSPVLAPLRRTLVPRSFREWVKAFWRVRIDRPEIPPHLYARLRVPFDEDLARLGSWLGIDLDCESFHEVASGAPRYWTQVESSPPSDSPMLIDR
jgi:hypothetical protein